MNPQELIQFRNEQNQSETELEFLAFILHGLRQVQKEGNELQAQDIAQDAKRMEEAKDGQVLFTANTSTLTFYTNNTGAFTSSGAKRISSCAMFAEL